MQDWLSNKYVKAARAALKWCLILCLVAGAGAGLSTLVAVPAAKKTLDGKGVLVERKAGGGERFVYGDEKTPHDFEQEMDYPPEQLIFQKQERFAEPEDYQPDDGGRMDLDDTPASERRAIMRLLEQFLPAWETFDAGYDKAGYSRQLSPFADRATLSDIAARVDARENTAVGEVTGSRMSRAWARQDVGDSLSVLRYSPDSAYVSVAGRVSYTGPSLLWQDRQMLRSYGVVLVNGDDGWKVARVAAETLSELTD